MTKRQFNASAIAFCGLLLIVGFLNKPRYPKYVPVTEKDARNSEELQLIRKCRSSVWAVIDGVPQYASASRKEDGSISCAGG